MSVGTGSLRTERSADCWSVLMTAVEFSQEDRRSAGASMTRSSMRGPMWGQFTAAQSAERERGRHQYKLGMTLRA